VKADRLQQIIEEFAPLDMQEAWDNSGYQVKLKNVDISRVLVAMEVTERVIDEAIDKKIDMIVTHHPMLFSPVKCVDDNTFIGNYIVKLITNGINVYSSHTPFDKTAGGNNDYLAKLLQLCDIEVMASDESGFCRVGTVDGECTIGEYIEQISKWLKIDKSFMSFCGNLDAEVVKVGLCTGAGAEFLELAAGEGCDLFITGDVKYHTAQIAKELGLNLLDIGHYGSEKIFVENMANYLRSKTDIEIIESTENLNPFVKL